jgi:glucan 1,3-beta-glucosidase
LLICAALAISWSWWHGAKPVPLPDVSASKLPCLSYAPSGHTQGAAGAVAEAQLRADFAALATRTRCVRTYTVSEGFDQVPVVAREFGIEVLLGLWIGRDEAHNEREIAVATRVARAHPDVIRALVVGNEVLLRQDLPTDKLATLIRRVAAATNLPVTYADVWGRWLDHGHLAQEVSFVTVHILPYWDDEPVAVDAVMANVDELYASLQSAFPGKKLFIGETGWPSAGRPRGAAVPSRVNQARYLREFTVLAARRGFDFNVIEAFDQPWKIAHEGTVGGHWGLYDGERREKFAWTGPVAESPRGRVVALCALLAGALAAPAGLARGSPGRARRAVALFAAAALAASVGARQWQYMVDGNVAWLDWLATVAICIVGWLGFLVAVRALCAAAGDRDPMPRVLALPLLFAGAYVCLGLVFAGRHRDFPVWLFLPGVLAMTTTVLCDPAARVKALCERRASEEVLLATWLAAAGFIIPALERSPGVLAIAWGLSCVLFAASVLAPLALQARDDERAAEQARGRQGEVVEHHPPRADDDG